MGVAKKNLFSILSGVVALLALVAVFVWPLPGWFEQLRTDVNARTSDFNTINTMLDTRAQLPRTSEAEEPVTLDRFPTRAVIKAGQESIDKLKAEAESVLRLAVQRNQKPLLMPRLLPAPDRSLAARFRQQYILVFNLQGETFQNANQWIGKRGSLGPNPQGQDVVLNGTMVPNERELAQLREQRAADIRAKLTRLNAQGQIDNADEVTRAVEQGVGTLAKELRDSRAAAGTVYVDYESFSPLIQIREQTPNDVQVFNAQLNLWIHQEFLKGVALANAKATSVLDAPVKHLLKLDIPVQFVQVPDQPNQPGMGGMGGMGGAPATPGDLPIDSTAELPKVQFTPTGRTHNSMYDPFRFTARLRVSASALPQVIADLQRNRFITVTNVASITAVDSAVQLGFGYKYGNDPVVEVLLECEALLLRQWLVPLMPPAVKAALANAANPQAGQGGGPGEGYMGGGDMGF
jgi:hypothetical protein